jgi:hypothetical protein
VALRINSLSCAIQILPSQWSEQPSILRRESSFFIDIVKTLLKKSKNQKIKKSKNQKIKKSKNQKIKKSKNQKIKKSKNQKIKKPSNMCDGFLVVMA